MERHHYSSLNNIFGSTPPLRLALGCRLRLTLTLPHLRRLTKAHTRKMLLLTAFIVPRDSQAEH